MGEKEETTKKTLIHIVRAEEIVSPTKEGTAEMKRSNLAQKRFIGKINRTW